MLNFEIRVIDREMSIRKGFVQLGFFSNVSQTLIIKGVRFYPQNIETKITSIDPVLLGDREVIKTFGFSNEHIVCEKLEFLLKQEGSKGWKVSVDLNTDAVPKIEEAPFQVL